jgi:hypothetical protein
LLKPEASAVVTICCSRILASLGFAGSTAEGCWLTQQPMYISLQQFQTLLLLI